MMQMIGMCKTKFIFNKFRSNKSRYQILMLNIQALEYQVLLIFISQDALKLVLFLEEEICPNYPKIIPFYCST